MFGRSLLAVFVLALLASPFASSQEEFRDDIRRLLNDGVDLYKRGKYAEAYGKFEEAFQKQPSNDLVYAFIQRVGSDVVLGMMSAPDEKIKATGYRLMELAKPGERIRQGKKEIQKYLEDLGSTEHAVQRNAHWHLLNFGPYAVRFIVPTLGNQLPDLYRSRLMLVLTDMGPDATFALTEALNSKNAFLRQNAAIVLGNIKDDRAVAALRRVQSSANEVPEVKKFAHEALIKITRQPAEQWKEAKDYYYDLADNYYTRHPGAIHAWNRAWLIWRWDEEKDVLTEREVPRFAYNEQLAEEALYDCLAIDPSYRNAKGESAWALLACVHFAQALEAEAGVAAAEAAVKAGDPGLKPDHVEGLKKLLAAAERNNVSGKIPGREFLYEALGRSIREKNALVAVSILDTLRNMAAPEELPSAAAPTAPGTSLVDALTNEDKRVRYAAASAYVALNPGADRLGMPLVIPNLRDALGESGVRVALLVYDVQDDNDRTFVNAFRKLLLQNNVFPVIATSGQDGVIKAKQFPSEDVIIVQKKICGQIYFQETESRRKITESVFDTLRDDVRTRNIARVVLCDSGAELEDAKKQFDQTAQGFLTRDADLLGLRAVLEKIFSSPEAQKDAKDRADRLAQTAAESLASIDPRNTTLPYPDAVEALIGAVSPDVLRAEFIRLPSARALGRFGDQRAIDVLSKALAVKSEDPAQAASQKAVRLQCARSLAQIFQKARIAPAKEVFENLKKQLLDGDYDIEAAVGEALGNADLTPAQRVEAELHRRVNARRDVKTPDDE